MSLWDSIAVVIATSNKRTNLLETRSLRSVYLQKDVNPAEVVIVDDNWIPNNKNFSEEYLKIKKTIHLLKENVLRGTYLRYIEKKKENISYNDFFKTTLLKNSRTHAHSGTGAWNSAIFYLHKKYKNKMIFVAILDDDDKYLDGYLKECKYIIEKFGKKTAAIFPYILWHFREKEIVFKFSDSDLTPRAFYLGNPGVQGSNMCIRLDLLMSINGFDENLHSATDRDLMIRLLHYLSNVRSDLTIKIIPKVMVVHYADRIDSVTNNRKLKKLGLDFFYSKWKDQFSQENFIKSLERAKRLFGYEYRGYQEKNSNRDATEKWGKNH